MLDVWNLLIIAHIDVTVNIHYKYELLMHGIKVESFAKFIFEWK